MFICSISKIALNCYNQYSCFFKSTHSRNLFFSYISCGLYREQTTINKFMYVYVCAIFLNKREKKHDLWSYKAYCLLFLLCSGILYIYIYIYVCVCIYIYIYIVYILYTIFLIYIHEYCVFIYIYIYIYIYISQKGTVYINQHSWM